MDRPPRKDDDTQLDLGGRTVTANTRAWETAAVNWPPRSWTAADVPSGPYFHGSRLVYEVGECLRTDIVSDEDLRRVCFATTSLDDALDWACRRGIRHGGDFLLVYEVAMDEPEVDVNMHQPGSDETITSVMSARGVVIALVLSIPTSECTNPIAHGFCPCPRPDHRSLDSLGREG